MATTTALPDVGLDVPMPPGLDLAVLDELSVGQLAYVKLAVTTTFAARMTDPATAHEFSQFTRASGADWSGHEGPPPVDDAAEQAAAEQYSPTVGQDPVDAAGNPIITPRPVPAAPECRWDTVPFIAEMIRRSGHAQDAVVTSFARHLAPMFQSQPEFFGTPEGINAFNDSTAYFKEVLRFSAKTTKKIHDRLPYVTWNPGQDPTMGMNQPMMRKLAAAFTEGMIPAENLDRIIWLDQDLTKYVQKTTARPEDKDAVLRQFEPTLVEAAQVSNPDAFNAARRRWADTIAHSLDADGPPVAAALRKPADNILRDQAYADGSGRVSVHLTPEVFAEYKNFILNQLNRNGTPLAVDDSLTEWLYTPATDDDTSPHNANEDRSTSDTAREHATPDAGHTQPADSSDHTTPDEDTASNNADAASDTGEAHTADDGAEYDKRSTTPDGDGLFDDLEADYPLNTATLEDLSIDRDPEVIIAEAQDGTPVTQGEVETIESLSPGQLVGAILIGALKAIFTMDPAELQHKKSHGAAATLTIIQDIETAYKTLGLGAIPEEAQRPRGPHGVVPTVITRPNPEDPATPVCNHPEHQRGQPPPWTGYVSEALNIGALHPKDAEPLACDATLVGQIWNAHHSVLNQRRAHRIFTPAQRRAILARDRGCQTPGCTIIAALCQIHHIEPWEAGGTTDVGNAITLCAHHHGAVHNTKWTIRTINGTHYFQPAPWLDPTQPLLRNIYWAL